jgi:hypothetical protein
VICPFPVMVHPHVPMQLAPLSKAKRLVEQGWLAENHAVLSASTSPFVLHPCASATARDSESFGAST